ncbi:hypothetical protein HDU98_004612, partial [Podochytrium sp. JEL0797]
MHRFLSANETVLRNAKNSSTQAGVLILAAIQKIDAELEQGTQTLVSTNFAKIRQQATKLRSRAPSKQRPVTFLSGGRESSFLSSRESSGNKSLPGVQATIAEAQDFPFSSPLMIASDLKSKRTKTRSQPNLTSSRSEILSPIKNHVPVFVQRPSLNMQACPTKLKSTRSSTVDDYSSRSMSSKHSMSAECLIDAKYEEIPPMPPLPPLPQQKTKILHPP